MMKIFVCLFFLALCGCDKKNNDTELINKSEYSVLQSFEYKYSGANHDKNFILVHDALGTHYDVLAFPISKAKKGYVVMLANADSEPKDKRIPEEEFVVNAGILTEVKKLTILSVEVERLIRRQIGKAPEEL